MIKPSVLADSQVFFDARNDKESRKYSGNKKPLDRVKHEQWFKDNLLDCWTIFEWGGPCGYLRKQRVEVVSIGLLSDFRGLGIAKSALDEVSGKLLAFVHKGNKRSVKLFKKCGFKQKDKNFIVFERD